MVLTTMGSIRSNDPLSIWEFVGLKLHDMVLDGLIEEKKLDTFNMPYYASTADEVKEVIEAEGSFILQNLETFRNDWDCYIKQVNCGFDKKVRAAIIFIDIRAVGEPILWPADSEKKPWMICFAGLKKMFLITWRRITASSLTWLSRLLEILEMDDALSKNL
ncbi:S-adenosyl-L-methionine:benzoic acid/salicylic acid carboxyl methyltransferase 2-like [Rosa chinensis]|uniref:S-adenosyl-L-methionine:benzoic acid/salicylic acid carboxyl methyltransferase 2-like n=1 Tax=Rosa chinensis TaxID=74649 RepID=UPI000D0972CD|nr:S-adenosyl-L-methionine:benzoic acid/salicylic acid carboxyl methyltransferase 2-like [Rosa chinensis]